ncbi:transglycosylase domain-containing protein [Chloroflexota bacterium]
MTDHNSDYEQEDAMQPTQPMLPQEMLPPEQSGPRPAEEETLTMADIPAVGGPHGATVEHTQADGMGRVPPPTAGYYESVPPGSQATQPQQTQRSAALAGNQPPQQYSPPPSQQPYGAGSPHRAGPPQRPPRRRKRRRGCRFGGCLITLAAALLVFLALVLVVGLVVVGVLSAQLEEGLARLNDIPDRQTFQTTVIYDRNGEELYQIFDEGRRTNIALEDLPPYVKWSTIAIEDDSFYDNIGVDVGSIVRAALQNVQYQESLARPIGASTITQQLVRNVVFDYEYRTTASYQRKIEEAILSVILTNRMSKDDILELYLNEIYFGNLAYGIEAASQTIFGKSATELTRGEAALLAGLPQAPGELDPLNPDPEIQQAVLERRRLVIDLMLDKGFITADEAYSAYGEPLSYANPDVPLVAPHFTVAARDELELVMETLGYPPDVIASGGLKVFTTLDLRFQDLAEQTARNHVASLRDAHHLTNAAVVVLHPFTGEILSMVGSVDYWDNSIDGRVNVALAARQPGSTMKPFTYASAIEQGWSPSNIIWDTEIHLEVEGQPTYSPVNYDGRFHGPVRVRDALANSYNIPAVQTLRQVGVSYLMTMMERLGVESLGEDASHYGLSLTLGGGEVTLLEMTRAYSGFANGGLLVPSTMIRCVLDSEDNVIYQYENGCPYGQNTPATFNVMAYGLEALDSRVAFLISDILADNNARTPAMGARSPLYTGDLVSSVKTGTTNDTRDNWTLGYTRNVAVGVWAGNSDNTPMVNTSGLTGAAPIWNEVLTGIYQNPDLLAVLAQNGELIPDYLTAPPGLSRNHVCEIGTLQDPAVDCPATRVEWFLESPALVPDGLGNMVTGSTHLAPPLLVPDPAANGPQLNEPERGLFQALVKPVTAEMAGLVPTGGGQSMPAARYCLIPNEVDVNAVPGAAGQLFIGPPPDPEDAVYAAQWAQANNIPYLPWSPCTGEALVYNGTAAGSAPVAGPPVVEAYISAPAPGETVTGDIPIIGTANFTPQQAVFYKIELRGGSLFPEWVTLGSTHQNAVVDGQLETLGASGLPAGTYFIRLILVALDGNYLQAPYEVSFIVP